MNLSTRQRLVEAASALFAERGYSGASVRDICNLARVNPGAVSYHFCGKRQLYRTAL
jgi:AcrR family transcriptional regulator